MSIRSYVLASRGIGLSFSGLFACAIGLIVSIGLYVVAIYFVNEIAMLTAFLDTDIGKSVLEKLPLSSHDSRKLQEIILLVQTANIEKLKSVIGLFCIGLGVFIFVVFVIDFLIFLLICIILNAILGTKLSIPQQGRLLVVPWIIYTIFSLILTYFRQTALFWWLNLLLRIYTPTIRIDRSMENVFAYFVPMWWASLVLFVVFILIYLVQAQGVSIYKERRQEQLKK